MGKFEVDLGRAPRDIVGFLRLFYLWKRAKHAQSSEKSTFMQETIYHITTDGE